MSVFEVNVYCLGIKKLDRAREQFYYYKQELYLFKELKEKLADDLREAHSKDSDIRCFLLTSRVPEDTPHLKDMKNWSIINPRSLVIEETNNLEVRINEVLAELRAG